MSEKAIDDPDATKAKEFVYDQSSAQQNSKKFCNDVPVSRSEVDLCPK